MRGLILSGHHQMRGGNRSVCSACHVCFHQQPRDVSQLSTFHSDPSLRLQTQLSEPTTLPGLAQIIPSQSETALTFLLSSFCYIILPSSPSQGLCTCPPSSLDGSPTLRHLFRSYTLQSSAQTPFPQDGFQCLLGSLPQAPGPQLFFTVLPTLSPAFV